MDELGPLVPPGVAIVGRVFTENFGVEKVVTNVVANPRVRAMILCGTESRHRVGQTLLALHANGRDEDGRVAGAESPQPFVRSLSEAAVRIYREKLTIVDLRGEDSGEAIVARAREVVSSAGEPWPEDWKPDVPITRAQAGTLSGMSGRAGRFTLDPTGLFLIGVGPWGDTIELEHYTREGHLDHRIVGSSADAVCHLAQEKGFVGDLSHALYLGRETQKAELAMRLSLSYE